MTRQLELKVLTERFAIARLEPEAAVPDWVDGKVTCIARTPKELSILCEESRVPDSVRVNRPWSCFEVAGPLDFSEIGILHSLTATLSQAAISVFVFSTFDTDYILVPQNQLVPAIDSLEEAGHRIVAKR